MNIAFFSAKPYDCEFFNQANTYGFDIRYLEPHLNAHTVQLANGCETVCAFVNDSVDAEVLVQCAAMGIRHLALRCAGFNNVDMAMAEQHQILISRVPAYSPYAVAEHTVALLLALNRKVHRAYNRIREGNFALDGLLGSDLHGQTVGIVGTGEIGSKVAKIMNGFGCKVLACDPIHSSECEQLGVGYVEMDRLLAESDVITLHCPLTPDSRYLINEQTMAKMKNGVVLLNTSRGALVDTRAVIQALKSEKIGSLGLDVYEEEGDFFFENLSGQVIQDDCFCSFDHLSQCDYYWSPRLFYSRSADQHRRYDFG